MIVPIRTARMPGMVTDAVDYTLPPDVFTLVQNGRPRLGGIERGPVLKGGSYTNVSANSFGMFLAQYATLSNGTQDHIYMFYGSSIKLHRVSDLDDVSGAAYTGSYNNRWNVTRFNDSIVATNGKDMPQYHDLSIAASPGTFANVVGFPAASWAKIVFSLKNFLVFANINKNTVLAPTMVKWGHPSASGMPSTWDETDPTYDAGEAVLTTHDGAVIQASAPFEDGQAIYTDDEVWMMRFIGGNSKFGFYRQIPGVGALNMNCVLPLTRSTHIVVTPDFDILQHNMQTSESILTHSMRKTILEKVGVDTLYGGHLIHNRLDKEVWFLFCDINNAPTTDTAELAAVWNYKYNSWSLHDLPKVYSAFVGYTSMAWTMNNTGYSRRTPAFHYGDIPALAIFPPQDCSIANKDVETARASLTFRLERTGLAVKGADKGQPVVDYDAVAQFQEFRPKARGTIGDTIAISFGTRMHPSETVSFGTPVNYTIGSDVFVPILKVGRLLDIRMDYTDMNHALTIEGYDLDVEAIARH